AATTYPLNKTLVETVSPVGQVLHSKHGEGHSGVIQSVGLKEHKTDVKKSIHDRLQTVPFVLRSLCGVEPVDIHVDDPKSASYLMDDLTSTHDVFTPADGGGFLSRTIDRLSGDVVLGYHETEKMLLTNTFLLGIGEIRYLDERLVLKPPINGSRFILTTKSKAEVIKSLESKSFWIKVFAVGTGVVGVSIFCHILYKTYKKNQADRAKERTLAEMRELRQRAVTERDERGGERDEDIELCVVCLSNPREIVLLNCGHICLCVDCVSELPEPLTCPF
ncbi:MUL1A-like protein, partial [Mya arenaria]